MAQWCPWSRQGEPMQQKCLRRSLNGFAVPTVMSVTAFNACCTAAPMLVDQPIIVQQLPSLRDQQLLLCLTGYQTSLHCSTNACCRAACDVRPAFVAVPMLVALLHPVADLPRLQSECLLLCQIYDDICLHCATNASCCANCEVILYISYCIYHIVYIILYIL